MCDPVSLTLGAVAGGTVLQAREQRKAAKEMRSEGDSAAAAEAAGLQAANRELAATRERRRQQSLLMTGASQPTFGDSAEPGTLMSSRATAPQAPARQQSLMSRGGM